MTTDERELSCLEYRVAKETPCGYWLYLTWGEFYAVYDDTKVPEKGHWMWRSKTGHYAHEDKAVALDSYIMRKGRHLKILDGQRLKAKIGLAMAKALKSGEPIKPQKRLPGVSLFQRLLAGHPDELC